MEIPSRSQFNYSCLSSYFKYGMDKKQFREFLESVAELKDHDVKSSPNHRIDPDNEEWVLWQGEWIKIEAKSNPTLGFGIKKLKSLTKPCELNCGKQVQDQRIERKFYTSPSPHWRTRCVSCNQYQSPDKSKMVNNAVIWALFDQYLKEKNPDLTRPKSKKTK